MLLNCASKLGRPPRRVFDIVAAAAAGLVAVAVIAALHLALHLLVIVARNPICAGRRARGEQERLDGGVGGRAIVAARAVERR